MKRQRGFTMIEMLVMLSIVALLMVALVVFLLGSDDRRCRLEAERLAAWLQAASAEGVMSDGPVRAAVDLEAQKCTREVSEMSADIRAPLWKADEREVPFLVRRPVRAIQLTTSESERTDGIGWIVFTGRRTRGGVVILSLEEAVYSVVVPPDDQPVRVEKGRVDLPVRPEGPLFPGRERPPLAALGGDGPGSRLIGDPLPLPSNPDPEVPLVGNPPESPPDDPPEDPPVDPPEDPLEDPLEDPPVDPPGEPAGDPEVEAPDAGVEDTPDAALPADEEDPCSSHSECEQRVGRWGYCGPPEERDGQPEQRYCGKFPHGVSFFVGSVQVQEPHQIKSTVQSLINTQIQAGSFSLMVHFSGAPAELERPATAPRSLYLVQADQVGDEYVVSEVLPAAALSNAQWIPCGDSLCWQVAASTQGRFGLDALEIYLATNVGSCDYSPLTIATDVMVQVDPGSTGTATLRVTGALTPSDAAKFRARISGVEKSLRDILGEYLIPLTIDTNADGVADAWPFQFTGRATERTMSGDPANAVSNDPCP